MAIGQDLLNVPMGDMILQMALAIAESQFELDKSSIMVAEMMGGQRLLRDEEGRLIDYDGTLMASKRDAHGNPSYDQQGRLEYEEGHGPRVIDSRVFFGYTYEPMLDGQGNAMVWPNGATKMARKPQLVSMLELGFTPNFYQFVDSIIEVKIAIKTTTTTDESRVETDSQSSTTTQDLVQSVKQSTSRSFRYRNAQWGKASFTSASGSERTRYKQVKTGQTTNVSLQNVDATYSSKYNYSAEGASLLRTKLVPVPPPAVLEDRIRQVMDMEAKYQELAAQGLHGVVEKVGDEPALAPTLGRRNKLTREITDGEISGGIYAPDASTVAGTGTFVASATAPFTLVLPTAVTDARFTLQNDGTGTVTVSHGSSSETVAASSSKVLEVTTAGVDEA